jgi:hypothetical protein
MMQSMLMQKLQQNPQTQSIGGMEARTNPMQGAAQLAQKVMLMRALQNPPPTMAQRQATNMIPQTQAMNNPALAQNPQIQAMQQGMQQPMPLNLNVPPMAQPDPSLMPTPGYS